MSKNSNVSEAVLSDNLIAISELKINMVLYRSWDKMNYLQQHILLLFAFSKHSLPSLNAK